MDLSTIIAASGGALGIMATLAGAVVWVSKQIVGDLPERVTEVERAQATTHATVTTHEALISQALGEIRGELRSMRDDLGRVREDVAALKARK